MTGDEIDLVEGFRRWLAVDPPATRREEAWRALTTLGMSGPVGAAGRAALLALHGPVDTIEDDAAAELVLDAVVLLSVIGETRH